MFSNFKKVLLYFSWIKVGDSWPNVADKLIKITIQQDNISQNTQLKFCLNWDITESMFN
jgi:hypothetical protein